MEDWRTWNNVGRKEGKRTFLEVKQERNIHEGKRRRVKFDSKDLVDSCEGKTEKTKEFK